ncbi:hypothetical protein L228DRAFT_280004 [Xylona heveae TC161]|uniref:3'-5' exonuclease domain-containing protein n=1 Tax=Xylona heveae (strain CBS 132557 / TC161) TaxID=1328760 RepID=A0A165K0K1_XYLHT|nr:hypothetical protein L228DRAFT_280004 [Xylona heveae TC161]KZF26854.1 hypothetical protein L228DRAFT_280004 [Xylona heveae TC161]
MFALFRSDAVEVRLTRHCIDGYRRTTHIGKYQSPRCSGQVRFHNGAARNKPNSRRGIVGSPKVTTKWFSGNKSKSKQKPNPITRKALTTEARALAFTGDNRKHVHEKAAIVFAARESQSRNHELMTVSHKRRRDSNVRKPRRRTPSPTPNQARRAQPPHSLPNKVPGKAMPSKAPSKAVTKLRNGGSVTGHPQGWKSCVPRPSRPSRRNPVPIERGTHLLAQKPKKPERRRPHEAALAAVSELERRKVIAAALERQEKGTHMWSWAPSYLRSGEPVLDVEHKQIRKSRGYFLEDAGDRNVREETKIRIDAYYDKYNGPEYIDIRKPFSAFDWARIDHFYSYLDLPRHSPRLRKLFDYYEKVYRPNDKDLAYAAHNFRIFLLLRLLTNRLPGCWQHLKRRLYLFFPLQEQEGSMKKLIDELEGYNQFCQKEKLIVGKAPRNFQVISLAERLRVGQEELHKAYDRIVWPIIDFDRRNDSIPERERHRIMSKFTGILPSLGYRGPIGDIAKLQSQIETLSETIRFSRLLKIGYALKLSSYSLKHAIERFEEFVWLSCMRRAAKSDLKSDETLDTDKWTYKTGLASRIREERRILRHLNLRPTNRLMHQGSAGTSCFSTEAGQGEYFVETLQDTQGQSETTDDRAYDDGESYVPLSYSIPEAVMRQAMLASSTSVAAYWQYDLYEGPQKEKVKVHYCRSRETTERVAQLFLDKKVLGFDIEWKPHALPHEGIKKNASLIQLASEDRIALFHIARYSKGDTVEDLVAPSLRTILESPNISKVGVSIKADCTRLRRFLNIDPRGLFELSHLYKLVKYSSHDVSKVNKKLVSLAQQVEEHLQLPMRKGEVRSSNWAEELNMQQIIYAASDSYAGLRLFDVLEQKRMSLHPRPPRPAHAELNLPIRLADGHTMTTTADEPTELEEDPATASSSSSSSDPSASTTSSTQPGEESNQPPLAGKSSSSSSSSDKQKPPEVLQAEAWTATWRAGLPSDYKTRASPAHLRAYALWHDQSFDPPVIARLLRDPPLQTTTVSSYILEAIRLEKLPYDPARLRDVISHLPEPIYERRYRALKRDLEGQ